MNPPWTVASRTVREKPKFQLASKEFPVDALTFGPKTVPGMLPHWHGVGLQAPKPSTMIPPPLGETTMATTLLVAGFVFFHVPNRTGFGPGGVGLASAGTEDDSSAAATAVVVMSAAMAARGVSFTRCSPPAGRPSVTTAVIDTEAVTARQIHHRGLAMSPRAGDPCLAADQQRLRPPPAGCSWPAGTTPATLEQIADEAGFSKGVVYSRFASKADLFLALLEDRIAERGPQNAALAQDLAGSGEGQAFHPPRHRPTKLTSYGHDCMTLCRNDLVPLPFYALAKESG